jgi:hypothetical protein
VLSKEWLVDTQPRAVPMATFNIGVRSVRTGPNREGNTSFETALEILRHWKTDVVGVAMSGQESVWGFTSPH